MAHVDKFTVGASGNLFAHYERKKDAEGNHRKYGNQDIDLSKSDLNYNLAKEKNQIAFLRQRLTEVRVLKRKDVNVMADWVVTLPREMKNKPQEEKDKFFQESYNFLENEYGKENVISSYVHLDETTPHMHFAFVPVVTDKKRGDLKVSAKELLNRTHLKQFHLKLEEHLNLALGYNVGVLNEATKDGNRSIQELKRGTATQKLNQLNLDIEKKIGKVERFNREYPKILNAKRKELEETELQLEKMKEDAKIVDLSIEKNESHIITLKSELKALEEEIDRKKGIIDRIENWMKPLSEEENLDLRIFRAMARDDPDFADEFLGRKNYLLDQLEDEWER